MAFALADYSVAEQGRLFPHLVASYSMAYAIGFLSFITPSGFGVREGHFIFSGAEYGRWSCDHFGHCNAYLDDSRRSRCGSLVSVH